MSVHLVNPDSNIDHSMEALVEDIWEDVFNYYDKVLKDADIHGFDLINLPKPNVKDFLNMLDVVIIPVLDRIADKGNTSYTATNKIINMKQCAIFLRQMVVAIQANDAVGFESALKELRAHNICV